MDDVRRNAVAGGIEWDIACSNDALRLALLEAGKLKPGLVGVWTVAPLPNFTGLRTDRCGRNW